VEGALLARRFFAGENPGSLGATLRYSGETDYHSAMATLSASREFFQRNTALSGYLGGGVDISDPETPPPGQSDSWPAGSTRLALGLQAGQLLSPRLRAGASYAMTWLSGTLENPNRRARIVTTLFPENVPNQRIRHVAAAEFGAYLGFGVAAFHRQGGYFDSWGVRAWIPETAFPVEIGERWLVTPRHKYYYQLPADFYRTSYPASALGEWTTGDVRLGHLESHEIGLDLEYAVGSGMRAPSVFLSAAIAELDYLGTDRHHRSYVVSLGFRSPE
jgi:hypothetical protein